MATPAENGKAVKRKRTPEVAVAKQETKQEEEDLVAARLVKRVRTPLRPLSPIEIPTFRVVEDYDNDAADVIPPKAKKAKVTAEKKEEDAEEEEGAGDDDNEEESSESISLHSDYDSDEDNKNKALKQQEEPSKERGIDSKRSGPRGQSALARFTRMSENWESYSAFPKNTIRNLMRLARIFESATREHKKSVESDVEEDDKMDIDLDGDEDKQKDEICLTKEAIPEFERYVSIRLSQIMESSARMHQHSRMKKMNANDVHLAVQSNPAFAPFSIETYMEAHREDAPAVVAFTDLLRVGKSNEKTQRIVFQHTDVSHKL